MIGQGIWEDLCNGMSTEIVEKEVLRESMKVLEHTDGQRLSGGRHSWKSIEVFFMLHKGTTTNFHINIQVRFCSNERF